VPREGHVKYTQREKESDTIMKSKMVAIFATLMVALMIAGIAYAHWSKAIRIDGTVTTGTFELEPTCEIRIVEPTDKKVANVSCEIDYDNNIVTYWMNNTFPSLKVYIKFDLHNTGSVPAGLYKIKFKDSLGTTWEYTAPDIPKDMGPIIEGSLPAWIEVESITWGGVPFGQIDPGDTAYVEFVIHFTEDTPPDFTYQFSFGLEYWNWNEVPKPTA